MKDVSHRESLAFSARVLGALFYFAPDSEQTAPLVSALTAGDWVQDWPLADADPRHAPGTGPAAGSSDHAPHRARCPARS